MYQRTLVILALIAFVVVMRWPGGDGASTATGAKPSGAAVFDIAASQPATAPATTRTTTTALTRPALVEQWPRLSLQRDARPDAGAARRWASEATSMTWFAFYLPDRRLYSEEPCLGRDNPRPSFLWPATVQLAALAAAARLEPDLYLRPLREYLRALRTYRSEANGIVGLEVLPHNNPSDRYYDDNAWLALSALDAYAVTKDASDLGFAREALGFALGGEDPSTCGGGIYWHEQRRDKKHACTSAPVAVAALRLYQLTAERSYLDAGRRLSRWMNDTLRDPEDGLYFDSVRVADGTIDERKFTYNTAMMIRAECLLHEFTAEPGHADRAGRLARAAEAHWVLPSGAIADEGKFAHKLAEAFLAVYELDHDPHWLRVVGGCVKSLHDDARDARGLYCHRWDETHGGKATEQVRLADQAAAARLFWVAAGYELPSE